MGLFTLMELPTLIVLGGLGSIVGFVLWRSQRSLAAQPKVGPPPGPGVQAHGLIDDPSGRLDAKIDALQRLVRQADRVATRLETALKTARSSAEPPPEPVAEPDPVPVQPSTQAEALTAAGGGRHDVRAHGAPRKEEARRRPPADQRYEEIYRLSDFGLDTTEIARRVGTLEGEVELILGLRRER